MGRVPLSHAQVLFSRYIYVFTPPQLCFLCSYPEETGDMAGGITEIDCSAGFTTGDIQ